MPYTRMNVDECYAFCAEPVRPAILATVRRDGRPHAAPIWFALDEGEFVFTTGRDTIKGRNLRRNPRLTLCVQDDRPPFSYVLVEGSAALNEDPQALVHWATSIGGRYMGAARADEYGTRNAVAGEMVVRVRVSRISGVRDVAV
jgi:PPOX class probable F420-dependent enzyme